MKYSTESDTVKLTETLIWLSFCNFSLLPMSKIDFSLLHSGFYHSLGGRPHLPTKSFRKQLVKIMLVLNEHSIGFSDTSSSDSEYSSSNCFTASSMKAKAEVDKKRKVRRCCIFLAVYSLPISQSWLVKSPMHRQQLFSLTHDFCTHAILRKINDLTFQGVASIANLGDV